MIDISLHESIKRACRDAEMLEAQRERGKEAISSIIREFYTEIADLDERIEAIECYLNNNAIDDEECDDYCCDDDWISVEEELPDEFSDYLVTIKDVIRDGDKEYERRYVAIAQYSPKRCEWSEKGVIAWQDLVYAYEGK